MWNNNPDPNCGGTDLDHIDQGINKEFSLHGISTWRGSNTLPWILSWIFPGPFQNDVNEINNGYPFELSMKGGGWSADPGIPGTGAAYGNHSVAVIGYDISGSD